MRPVEARSVRRDAVKCPRWAVEGAVAWEEVPKPAGTELSKGPGLGASGRRSGPHIQVPRLTGLKGLRVLAGDQQLLLRFSPSWSPR